MIRKELPTREMETVGSGILWSLKPVEKRQAERGVLTSGAALVNHV